MEKKTHTYEMSTFVLFSARSRSSLSHAQQDEKDANKGVFSGRILKCARVVVLNLMNIKIQKTQGR